VEAGAQNAEAGRVVLDPVAAGVAEVLVVDHHPAAAVAVHPGEELADEGRVVAAFDPPLGDRERLAGEAAVEAGESLPFGVAGVEVGADPVDPARAGVEVFGPVPGRGGGAGGERAPDDRHRRRGQRLDVDRQRRQAGFVEAAVDRPPLAAAVEDHVDAAEGAFVGAGAVFGSARGARTVVGGVDVEAAVRLAERPDVGPHPLFVEELVEADQVAVALAGGDPRQADQLMPVVVVGGGDVEHRPRPRRLPAPDRIGEVAAPGAKGLDHRRMLVDRLREVPEVGHVAGVGDPEIDLLPGRKEQAGARRGGANERTQQRQRAGKRDGSAEFRQRDHP